MTVSDTCNFPFSLIFVVTCLPRKNLENAAHVDALEWKNIVIFKKLLMKGPAKYSVGVVAP